MRLYELFDQIWSWNWTKLNDSYANVDMSIGDLQYYVMIEKSDPRRLAGLAVHIAKYDEVPDWLKTLIEKNSSVYGIEFELGKREGMSKDDVHNITGTGQQYKVFATVMDIMKDYSQRYNVEWWYFEANGPSRQKLYDRMVNKFGRTHFTIDVGKHKVYMVQA